MVRERSGRVDRGIEEIKVFKGKISKDSRELMGSLKVIKIVEVIGRGGALVEPVGEILSFPKVHSNSNYL